MLSFLYSYNFFSHCIAIVSTGFIRLTWWERLQMEKMNTNTITNLCRVTIPIAPLWCSLHEYDENIYCLQYRSHTQQEGLTINFHIFQWHVHVTVCQVTMSGSSVHCAVWKTGLYKLAVVSNLYSHNGGDKHGWQSLYPLVSCLCHVPVAQWARYDEQV